LVEICAGAFASTCRGMDLKVYATFKKILYGRCPLDQRNGESDQPRCKSGGILIKDAFEKLGLSEYKEFIHFGLTSQDINNTAIPLSTKEAFEKVYMPSLITLTSKLNRIDGRTFNACTHADNRLPYAFGERNWCF
jgi:hypothetical protein